MIRYLETPTAVVILDKGIQWPKSDPYHKTIVEYCKDPESSPDNFGIILPTLEYESDKLTISKDGEDYEVFHNGKYRVFPKKQAETILDLIKDDSIFSKKDAVNFINSLARNYEINDFSDWYEAMDSVPWNFAPDGKIVTITGANLSAQFSDECKLMTFDEMDNNTGYTYIVVDPADISGTTAKKYRAIFQTGLKMKILNHANVTDWEVIPDVLSKVASVFLHKTNVEETITKLIEAKAPELLINAMKNGNQEAVIIYLLAIPWLRQYF